jgi:uncharacterized protein YdaU (DUF1376 family)
MNKAPAFQWYPKDCDSDENVRLMDDTEFGFYVRCLNHAWLNEGLPGDVAMIARLFHKSAEDIDRIWGIVGKCFALRSGRYVNPRQEQQREESRRYQEAQKAKADAMWKLKRSQSNAAAYAPAQPQLCSASASASASPRKEKPMTAKAAVDLIQSIQHPKPVKPKGPQISDNFQACWTRHHKHRKGESLESVFKSALSKDLDWGELDEKHQVYCKYWDVEGWKFCPITFWEWIENGMPDPPPPKATQGITSNKDDYYKPYEPPPEDEL